MSYSETIKKINSIKEKEFAKINNKRTYLESNSTCLLNPKFIKIGKNTLIPNYFKKVKFFEKIPVCIMKKASFGFYLIKIYLNFKQ